MPDNPHHFEKHLSVPETGISAIDLLAQETALSRQAIKKIMIKGAVWLTSGKHTQRLRRAKRELQQGQTLHLYYDKTVLEQTPIAPQLIVDKHYYSIWNKPYGVLSQGSKWGDHCTVTRWAEQHLQPQRAAFVVHRLDRAANGLILIAHEKRAATRLSALFQQRDIEKRYRIWVAGEFPATAETQPIRVEQALDGRHAISTFKRLQFDAQRQRSLLDVSIETGRKHQIRRHVASLGFPVIGDRLYGVQPRTEDLQLSAYYLAFDCPFSGEKQRVNVLSAAYQVTPDNDV